MMSSFMFSKFVLILVVLKVGASTSAKKLFDDFHEALNRGSTDAQYFAERFEERDINIWYDIDLASNLQGEWNNRDLKLAYRSSALNLALIHSEDEIACDLIDKGADISVADQYGNVPLHLAAENSLDLTVNKIMDIMNEAGMSKKEVINHINMFGKAPLHMAWSFKSENVLKKLLDEDAESMITDFQGNTALHLIIQKDIYGSEESTTNLIKKAGQEIVNIQNNQGETALYVAVSETKVGVVERLLKTGANPIITDNDGNTALELAMQRMNEKRRAQLLLQTNLNRAKRSLKERAERAELSLTKGFKFVIDHDFGTIDDGQNLLMQAEHDLSDAEKIVELLQNELIK